MVTEFYGVYWSGLGSIGSGSGVSGREFVRLLDVFP